MVVIPAGVFLMGSPLGEHGRANDEGAQQSVTVQRFAASKFEITRGEWSAFVAATGRVDPQMGDTTFCTWRDAGFTQDDRHPVVCVSWRDAQDYANWLSHRTGQIYRLLSEAEWEYAARAGTATPYWTGASITASQANFNFSGTRAVGSYPLNTFGLADTAGNVWEWVQDCYHRSYVGAPNDGSAWNNEQCTRHVLRGGSWGINRLLLRSAARYRYGPNFQFNSAGFRLARAL